jgi:uncharacterized membrane protein
MTIELAVLIALQWLHVIFAVFWFGSQMYATLVLWPEMRKLPSEHDQSLLANLRRGRARRFTITVAVGTVALGIIRGIAGGVLDRLATPYGITYLASLAIGLYMIGSILTRSYGGRAPSWAFNASFGVVFTLMILMRFGL